MGREKFKNVNWTGAIRAGLDKEYLERMGYMDILLDGGETPEIPLALRTGKTVIWLTGTIKLVEDPDGEIVVEVNGIKPQEDE